MSNLYTVDENRNLVPLADPLMPVNPQDLDNIEDGQAVGYTFEPVHTVNDTMIRELIKKGLRWDKPSEFKAITSGAAPVDGIVIGSVVAYSSANNGTNWGYYRPDGSYEAYFSGVSMGMSHSGGGSYRGIGTNGVEPLVGYLLRRKGESNQYSSLTVGWMRTFDERIYD